MADYGPGYHGVYKTASPACASHRVYEGQILRLHEPNLIGWAWKSQILERAGLRLWGWSARARSARGMYTRDVLIVGANWWFGAWYIRSLPALLSAAEQTRVDWTHILSGWNAWFWGIAERCAPLAPKRFNWSKNIHTKQQGHSSLNVNTRWPSWAHHFLKLAGPPLPKYLSSSTPITRRTSWTIDWNRTFRSNQSLEGFCTWQNCFYFLKKPYRSKEVFYILKKKEILINPTNSIPFYTPYNQLCQSGWINIITLTERPLIMKHFPLFS